jgi:DNA-binding NarL/FixJ family response regulator
MQHRGPGADLAGMSTFADAFDQPDPAGHPPGPRSRILIADDDPVTRSVLSRALGVEFEIVGTACDAAEAIALAERTRPDAAIVDLQMPDGGGLRATREICSRVPETAVVMLSVDECEPIVLETIEAGAMAYVRKNASYAALGRALRASIGARSPVEQDAA